jgi:hypothetical protein
VGEEDITIVIQVLARDGMGMAFPRIARENLASGKKRVE